MTTPTTHLGRGRAGGPGDPLGPLTGAVARLVSSVEELLAEAATSLDPVSSLQRTEAVLRVRAQLRAVELDGVRDADTRELYAYRDAGSVGTWLGAIPSAAGGGARLAVGRRVAASPAAAAALRSGDVAPVAVERVLAVVDRFPGRPLEAVAAAHTGVLETPVGRVIEPAEAEEAAERFLAVVTDGLREVIGPVPDPDALDAEIDRLAAPDCPSGDDVRERLTDALLVVARNTHPRLLTPALRDLTDALLPPPDPTAGDPRHTGARLVLQELLDGWGHIDGDLPPDAFQALRADLEHRVAVARAREDAQQHAEPDLTPPAEQGGTPLPFDRSGPAARQAAGTGTGTGTGTGPGPGDSNPAPPSRRATGRELHDAFVEHVRDTTTPTPDGQGDAQAASPGESPGAPGAAQPAPSASDVPVVPRTPRPASRVVITVTSHRLTGAPGGLVARTTTGRRVSDSSLGAALCHSGLTVLLTDARGATLDAASTRRTATPTQWAAMSVHWGGLCAAIGCGRPATVPHHVVPHHLLGPTTMDNQRPLCDASHDDIHLGGRTLRLRDGTVIGPTGWVVPPPDHPLRA